MLLPKKFEDRFGTHPEHKGKPKTSYSMCNSYEEEEYRDDVYIQYFLGIRLPSGEFAEFGSSVGEYIENKAVGDLKVGHLSDEDISILDKIIDYPDNAIYEDEIVIDFGEFVLEGYADRIVYDNDNVVHVLDYKTLNIDKKSEYYASDEYLQTVLYAYQKEKQGFKIGKVEVFGIGRKGSSLDGTGNFKMRLSGEYKVIPTPYNKKRVKLALDKIRTTTEKISKDYGIYRKYFC